MARHHFCTEVTPECPVSATTYGYRPSLPGNIFFLVVFSLCTLGQIFLGIRHRLRAFTVAVTIGCAGEAIGYGGRLMMHKNPWDSNGFKVQICCLVLAPSFLAAGIYLTLKHLVIYFGAEKSRLKPKLYTTIFISCDLVSILVQAAGGGIAASETSNLVKVGDDLIVAGIAFQVATQAVCLVLAADFAYQVYKNHKLREASTEEIVEGKQLRRGFRFYAISSAAAFLTIFIRCIYRIPEMAGGWGNPLMQNETEFLVLDGAMIAIACILLTVAHPGIFFPEISSRHGKAAQKEQDMVHSEDVAVSDDKATAWVISGCVQVMVANESLRDRDIET